MTAKEDSNVYEHTPTVFSAYPLSTLICNAKKSNGLSVTEAGDSYGGIPHFTVLMLISTAHILTQNRLKSFITMKAIIHHIIKKKERNQK